MFGLPEMEFFPSFLKMFGLPEMKFFPSFLKTFLHNTERTYPKPIHNASRLQYTLMSDATSNSLI